MAIEIVDLPIKSCDFHNHMVIIICENGLVGELVRIYHQPK